MAQAESLSQPTLQLRRTFSARREKIFLAWTDAEALGQWFFPSPDYTVKVALNLRVGGEYRVEMHHKNGNVHAVGGTYREILASEKLVFTWRWEQEGACETLVTVEFHDLGGATEIVLTHERFPSVEERDKHSHGWNGCLDQFAKIS